MVWSLTRPSLPYVRFKVTILEYAYKSARQSEENIRHSTVIASSFAPDLLTRGSAPRPRWGSALGRHCRLVLCTLATFFDLATPLALQWRESASDTLLGNRDVKPSRPVWPGGQIIRPRPRPRPQSLWPRPRPWPRAKLASLTSLLGGPKIPQ